MIFYFNANGVPIKVTPDRVFQNSNIASRIYFVAPISPGNIVNLAFNLPNGEYTSKRLMTNISGIGLTDGENKVVDQDGTIYSVWNYDLPLAITRYSGKVIVQFFITSPVDNNGASQVISTASGEFNVEKGVGYIEPTLEEDVYQEIINALATLNTELDNKQDLLVSGVNIKTLDNQSLVGSGNINAKATIIDCETTTITPNGSTTSYNVPLITLDLYRTIANSLSNASVFLRWEIGNGRFKYASIVYNYQYKTDSLIEYFKICCDSVEVTYSATIVGNIAYSDPITINISSLQLDFDDAINNKQEKLVSGVNIKTINNQDILGSGNIDILPVMIPCEATTITLEDSEVSYKVPLITVSLFRTIVNALPKAPVFLQWYDLVEYKHAIIYSYYGDMANNNAIESFKIHYNDLFVTYTSQYNQGNDSYSDVKINIESVDNDINELKRTKQDTLVSGVNIKTINNQPLLGSGNIVIEGSGGEGGSITVDGELSDTSTNPVENKVITEKLNKKLDKKENTFANANVCAYVYGNSNDEANSIPFTENGLIQVNMQSIGNTIPIRANNGFMYAYGFTGNGAVTVAADLNNYGVLQTQVLESGQTSGTIQASMRGYLNNSFVKTMSLDNEIYHLNVKDSTSGILLYQCISGDLIKTIEYTVSTGAWQKTEKSFTEGLGETYSVVGSNISASNDTSVQSFMTYTRLGNKKGNLSISAKIPTTSIDTQEIFSLSKINSAFLSKGIQFSVDEYKLGTIFGLNSLDCSTFVQSNDDYVVKIWSLAVTNILPPTNAVSAWLGFNVLSDKEIKIDIPVNEI